MLTEKLKNDEIPYPIWPANQPKPLLIMQVSMTIFLTETIFFFEN